MRRHLKKRNRIAGIFLRVISGIIAFIALVILLDFSITPTVRSVSAASAKRIMNELVAEAVSEYLSSREEPPTPARIITDEEGTITAISADMVEVNAIRSVLTVEILKKMEKLAQTDLTIPLGSLIGLRTLSGRGPGIPFRIVMATAPTLRLVSNLKSAGINQTCHSIRIQVSLSAEAILPFMGEAIASDNEILLSEVVLVGNVPQSYTHVLGDDSSTVSKINDYGAQ